MKTKLVKDIAVGDIVKVVEPDGTARVTSIAKSRLFRAEGGCFRLDLMIKSGPNKGKTIKDQHHAGLCAIEVPDA